MTISMTILQLASTNIETAITGAITGAICAAIFFAKKRTNKPPERWNWYKFLSTVIIGLIIGASYSYSGMDITYDNIVEQILLMGSSILLIEAILKGVVRYLMQKGVIPKYQLFKTEYIE